MPLLKKIAWVDCGSGAAGSMLLGALIDLGFPEARLKQLARAFKLGPVRFEITRPKRMGISGVLVRTLPRQRQPQRNFFQIKKILGRAPLPQEVKQKSIAAFELLARAEAKVHGTKIGRIHFHELGAVDTIIDIAGVILGFHELGIEKICASPIRLGEGEVKCAHGILPVPAPATLELVKGLPVQGGRPGDGELTTPTGALLIRSLARSFGPMPAMVMEKIGCGLGERKIETRPNVLRIALGQAVSAAEQLVQLETTIDDMNPEFFEPMLQALAREGALETALLPAQLKKSRPGVIVRLLCPKPKLEKVIALIFRHSTTTGIRFYEVERVSLPCETVMLPTRFGKIPVKKISMPGGQTRIHPEYERLAEIAARLNLPLPELEAKVKLEWPKKQKQS